MQRKALTVAVGAALVAMAGSASAAFTYTSTNTAVVNISGSSATNTQLKLYAQKVLCDATNQVTYSVDSNNFAIVCTPKAGAIGSLGSGKTNIAVVKDSSGGSGNGISPLINRTALPFVNVFAANVATCSGVSNCQTTAIPDLGLSDEEPALLVAAGAATGDVSKLNAYGLNVVTFGTPVTLGLWNALQAAQVASGKLPSSCTSSNTSEACTPSLTKAQIASIFSGNAVDWSEFGLTNTSGTGDNTIYVARRVGTSGTQTGSRVFFLNDPCAANVAQFVAGNSTDANNAPSACAGATASGTVYEASGSGNVETCLTNHQRNNRWAIGINSTEFPGVGSADQTADCTPGTTTCSATAKVNNDQYQRHIKIDGYAPTLFNVATGHYGDWVEASLNVYNGAALSTPAASLQNAMAAGFNDPVNVLPNLNSGFSLSNLLGTDSNGHYQAGIMAPAAAAIASGVYPATPATALDTNASPVNYFSHNVAGTPNTCQPAMTIFATGLN
jgi:ABC-type phosphate transport system substrate-binding protein